MPEKLKPEDFNVNPNINIRKETIENIENLKEHDNVQKIEAILFVAGKFLNMAELVSLSDLNPIIIREVIDKLKNQYEKSNSAIKIIEKNGMIKMDVSYEHSSITSKIATGNSEFSKAEQGTLAIIAFKQPIKQSIVVKIRGNKAYDHIKRFNELSLVKKKKTGHTYELSLADEFYNYFNISEQDITPQKAEDK